MVRRPRRKDQSQPHGRLDLLEAITNRTVTIATALDHENAAVCNQQTQSILWQTPAEIRALIFQFATRPYEDPQHPYLETAFFYRPGHRARHTICANLLRTCRLAWLEGNALPLQQADHCFWFERSPYNGSLERHLRTTENHRYIVFLDCLTPLGAKQITSLHFFTQMYWVEGFRMTLDLHFGPLARISKIGLRLKTFTITLRHTDWWDWEFDAPLRLDQRWVEAILQCPHLSNLERFVLEMETLEYRVKQMQPIVDRLVQLEGAVRTVKGSTPPKYTKLIVRETPEISKWTGPTNINKQEYAPYAGMTKLDYHVKTLVWRPTRASAPPNPMEVSTEPAQAGPSNRRSCDPVAPSSVPNHFQLPHRPVIPMLPPTATSSLHPNSMPAVIEPTNMVPLTPGVLPMAGYAQPLSAPPAPMLQPPPGLPNLNAPLPSTAPIPTVPQLQLIPGTVISASPSTIPAARTDANVPVAQNTAPTISAPSSRQVSNEEQMRRPVQRRVNANRPEALLASMREKGKGQAAHLERMRAMSFAAGMTRVETERTRVEGIKLEERWRREGSLLKLIDA